MCCWCFGEKEEKYEGALTKSFLSKGRTLGDAAPAASSMDRGNKKDEIPEPIHDPNMSEDDRAKQRAERAAAAEARIKKMGGDAPAKKKKPKNDDTPLTGPNSQPLMRWTAGS